MSGKDPAYHRNRMIARWIMTKRIKLTVAYDGTNYCGWQIQPNGDTIEAQLDRAVSSLLKTRIHVMGASRTDAGVHARGNVAVFDTQARMSADKYALALNTYLPPDIRVVESCEVPLTFHPRYQNTIKTYEYRIFNRKIPDPLERLYSLYYYWDLDEERMKQAAACLVGTHDFTSFCTLRPEMKDRIRTIYEANVDRAGDLITVRLTGNGFLYNMVRIIVGTLLRIGGGMEEPERMKQVLEAKDRSQAGDTARPEGLTLVQIRYPDYEKNC